MTRLILVAIFMLPAYLAQAGDWRSRTLRGNEVVVDPNTNRATVTIDGVTRPLWEGTHRMQDGSALIIHPGGIAVPNKPMLQSRRLPPPKPAEWEGLRIVGYSPCEKLVRSVCGKGEQCSDAQACDPARQLLVMEQEERAHSNNRNLMTYTSGQCLKASKDREFFTACGIPAKQ